ncbi:carboxylesterase family domain-containing protein [Ditylenchus destructor]|uniref:Carboxylic ester hydrolase n=1 Tax=Ditylenchus destructor TaxID=166010 RepID=A0AAD4MV60_9BILA|nr:carboxylesterase family domain-containing protein [Ditylenchus destructor]
MENHTLSDIVETQFGKVQGFTVTNDNGFQTNVFLGIPFAQPPVGELRFEKPKPPLPWKGVLLANKFADMCISPEFSDMANSPEIPISMKELFGRNFSEDCLYLNIYAPCQKVNEKYPVMFIIHGGAYACGGARMYRDYGDITNHFVSKGIVTVIIQYRLAVYGFASLGKESSLKGNLGLWDQTAALQFVHENVHNFGGDPNRITLYGCSAGSGSISALSISPHSRDLFSQAIQMSGSMYAEWSSSDRVVTVTNELVNLLGCDAKNENDAKRCLKNATEEEIKSGIAKVTKGKNLSFVKFGPLIDGDFFPNDLDELIKEAPKKPTYMGTTEEESMMWTVMKTYGIDESLYVPQEKQANYNKEDFVRAVKDLVTTEERFGSKAAEVCDKVVDFYINYNASEVEKNNIFYLRRYTQLISDIQFNVPIVREGFIKAACEWPVYLYNYAHLHKIDGSSTPFDAVPHFSDHVFIFRGENWYFPMKFDEKDEAVSDFMISSIASFIKTGNPSANDICWHHTTTERLEYVLVKYKPEIRKDFFKDRLNFWNVIAEEYGFDAIRGRKLKVE